MVRISPRRDGKQNIHHIVCVYSWLKTTEFPDTISPKSEPALELHTRAPPSVEAHHRSDGPETGRNSEGRRIKKETNESVRASEGHGVV